MFSQQVHELRLQYKEEWEAKVKAANAGKEERAAEFRKKVEEYRKIREEKNKFAPAPLASCTPSEYAHLALL